MTPDVDDEDIRAAALQYVRKVSGFRAPAAHNSAAFDEAVTAVTEATRRLLDGLEVRGAPAGRTAGPAAGSSPDGPVSASRPSPRAETAGGISA